MKKILLFLLTCGLGLAQQNITNVGTITWGPTTNALIPPSTVSGTLMGGATGVATYYYWIVAVGNGGIKSSPTSSPFIVAGVPNILVSGTNYIQLSWAASSGAVSYDVLRTLTPTLPNSANMAVATAVGTTTYQDFNNSPSSYTLSSANVPSSCTWTFLNGVITTPCLSVGGSGVTSFNSRVGGVVPQVGDYSSFYDAIGAAATAQSAAQSFAANGSNISSGTVAAARLGANYPYSSLAGAPTLFYQTLQVAGTPVTQRGTFNLVAGANTTLTPSDNGSVSTVTIAAGGVTSIGVTPLSWETVTPSSITGSGTFVFGAATGQTSHQVIGTCGSATSFGPCLLQIGDLPTGYLYSNLFGAPTIFNQTIQSSGTPVTQRIKLNIAAGSNISVTPTDNGTDTTTMTIAATGSTGVTTFNTRSGAVVPLVGDYSSFYDSLGAASAAQTAAQTFAANSSNQSSGTLNALRLPAFTGDATSSAGTSVLSVVKLLGNTIPSNAAGFLQNNGAGALSWGTPSGGVTTPATTNLYKGNGVANNVVAATPSTNSASGDYTPGSFTITGTGGVAESTLFIFGQYVNVEAFGAIGNGSTDNTTALNNAIAALTTGDTLYFPCTSGSTYRVTSPIDFGRLNHMNLAGKGNGCKISYFNSTTTNNYAFSLVGADQVYISNLGFDSDVNAANPPQTILLLGRKTGNAASGHFNLQNMIVGGNATKAVIYSITSEEDLWEGNIITLNGGGAKYVVFTSTKDELSVGSPLSATGTTNLSIWHIGDRIQDFTSGSNPTHALVFDSSDGNGGEHYYGPGYMSSSGGRGFQFNNNVTGPGAFTEFRSSVHDWRLENWTIFAYFSTVTVGGGDFLKDLRFYDNTFDSGAGTNFFSADANMGYQGLDFQRDNAENGETSALNNVNFSLINENFSVTTTTITNSQNIRPFAGTYDSYLASTLHSGLTSNTYSTVSNCSSSASPAVCGSAPAGNFVIAASTTTVTVNTTAVSANSQIFIQPDTSLGTKLGVTCNTATTIANDETKVTARVAGTSFSVAATGTFTTNPGCYSYLIVN